MEQKIYDAYCDILNQELLTALGCTEPIAIAYAGAKARQILGALPDSVLVEGSGNIIKNTKSVVVPNTDGQKGIDTAVSAGILFGNPDKLLQVLCDIRPQDKPLITEFAKSGKVKVVPADTDKIFYIGVTVRHGSESAKVVIEDQHTNITLIRKNDKDLLKKAEQADKDFDEKYSLLSVKDIIDFADNADLTPVKAALENQINLNSAISEEGLKNNWGVGIGRILAANGDVESRAIASAAAGSDARMSGCELPVVIALLTVSQVLPKLSSDLPAAVHADLAVESWRLVSSISARVALTAAFARFSAASASRTASEACWIFSGSLACCAACSCSLAPRRAFSYSVMDFSWMFSFSRSSVSLADRPSTLVSMSLMPAVASLNRLSARPISLPKGAIAK